MAITNTMTHRFRTFRFALRFVFVAACIGGSFAFGQGLGEGRAPGKTVTTRQLIRYATEMADALRASTLVADSNQGVQIAAPVSSDRLSAWLGAKGALGRLLHAINMRCGARVQFIARDANDPETLPRSSRFDYESKLTLRRRRRSSDKDEPVGWSLVLELFEPAGEKAVFAKDIPFAEADSKNRKREKDDRPSESPKPKNDKGKKRVSAEADIDPQAEPSVSNQSQKSDGREGRSVRERYEDESMVREVSLGRIEFEDKKTATRLAVLSEASKWLSDGRIRVQVTFVCRKKSRDVEIRVTFLDGQGHPLSKADKKDYEFEEGRPRTVIFRSRRPAAAFVMRIEKD